MGHVNVPKGSRSATVYVSILLSALVTVVDAVRLVLQGNVAQPVSVCWIVVLGQQNARTNASIRRTILRIVGLVTRFVMSALLVNLERVFVPVVLRSAMVVVSIQKLRAHTVGNVV